MKSRKFSKRAFPTSWGLSSAGAWYRERGLGPRLSGFLVHSRPAGAVSAHRVASVYMPEDNGKMTSQDWFALALMLAFVVCAAFGLGRVL